VRREERINSIRAHLVLKKWIEEEGLSGLAVECYPDFMGQICLAYSLFGVEGIPGSCEGDVNSLVAMIILHPVTKIPIHNTDLLAVYPGDNSIFFLTVALVCIL